MSEVIFEYKGNKITIQCIKEERMRDICIKLKSKIDININNIYLLYNGNMINLELKYKEIINRIDNDRNKMNILIYDKENEIICPNCGENININKDEITKYIKSKAENMKGKIIKLHLKFKNVDFYYFKLKGLVAPEYIVSYKYSKENEDKNFENNEIGYFE